MKSLKTNILVQRRKLLGYSQQDVAEKVGIDRSYYTKIENG
ncbi:helix-turn-helix transcriptional regulator, partial [Veillonella atypica]|nr:helix-turn-helix transcriptional regulator [Veillonella atypica]